MRVPHADRAVVAKSKVVDYLLSLDHPKGRDKAVFFGAVGFHADAWEQMAAALRAHVTQNEVAGSRPRAGGMLYSVGGPFIGPSGAEAPVLSVWKVMDGTELPELVTAYQWKRRSVSP